MKKILFTKQNNKSMLNRGFTLPELIVTIAIIIILSTIVVTGLRQADARITVSTSAHEIAMLYKRSQSEAINVSTGSTTAKTFGIYNNPTLNNGKLFTYFYEGAEEDGSSFKYRYEVDNSVSSVASFPNEKSSLTRTLPQNVKVVSSCLVSYIPFSGQQKFVCNYPNNIQFKTNVTYTRPNLQAQFVNPQTATPGLCMPDAVSYVIELASESYPEIVYYVIIEKSGLIYTSSKDIILQRNKPYAC